jgi:hypothetical protein
MRNLIFAAATACLLWTSTGFAQSYNDFIARTREVQDKVEAAYGATKAMDPKAMVMVLAATDDAMALFHDVALTPTNQWFLEEHKGRIYEEIIRGDRDNKERGSLARLFWASMTHVGFDANNSYDGKTNAYGDFLQGFVEVFNDLRSGVTFRKGIDGKYTWMWKDRINREKTARNLIVRFFDINEILNKNEKDDLLFDAVAEQLTQTVKEGEDLRKERLVGENLAIAFYAAGVGCNLLAPHILPFVQFDFVGYLTNDAWGAPLISGASYLTFYAGALGAKFLSKTKKTYKMIRELSRVLGDPVATLKAEQQGEEALKAKVKAEYKAYMDSIRAGQGVLGEHRANMIKGGYDPENFGKIKSDCEYALVKGQLFR